MSSDADTPNDETVTLLRRWHDGDRAALMHLLARDRDWVEERVRRERGPLLRKLEETGDGVQDLMVRVMDYAPRFLVASRRQFRALLARMIRHLLIDSARRLGRQPRPQTLSEADASRARLSLVAGHGVTPPADAAERSEELGWMRLGLEFLAEEDRQLIRARSFDELEFGEIGAEIGLEANSVRMRFNRALLKLAGVVERLKKGDLDRLLDG